MYRRSLALPVSLPMSLSALLPMSLLGSLSPSLPVSLSASLSASLSVSLSVSLLCLASLASAATIHVPGDQPTLQDAIDAAVPGDLVLVAPGTYTGDSNWNLDFQGKDVVLQSENGPDVTVIEGPGLDADPNNPVNCMSLGGGQTSATIVDGFTVRDFLNYNDTAGIEISCPATIRNCIFLDNDCYTGGAGAIEAYSDAIIEDCSFYGNSSGGGEGNAGSGGAILLRGDATVRRCDFEQNYAADGWDHDGAGGAIAIRSGAVIEDCTFARNYASYGNAIYVGSYVFGDPIEVWVSGCTIADNAGELAHSQVHYYPTHDGPGSCRLYVTNSVLWGGDGCPSWLLETEGSPSADSRVAFICSVVDRSKVGGTITVAYDPHSIEDDPLFCDPYHCDASGSGDYRLQAGSPCLPENSPCGARIGATSESCGVSSIHDHDFAYGGTSGLRLQLLGPNPASTTTHFALDLTEQDQLQVAVFDASGRRVRKIAHETFAAGTRMLSWDLGDDNGRRVPAGVYALRVRSSRGDEVERLTVVR
ncbi:MAG: right-handed parallel beta-helix repeat-containing protein [Candidatus Eisenbacteria bacterium]|nr:right-handed parallel beta-helix repeat-containing protein [Candidatus Eisenbacteria bacterium]